MFMTSPLRRADRVQRATITILTNHKIVPMFSVYRAACQLGRRTAVCYSQIVLGIENTVVRKRVDWQPTTCINGAAAVPSQQ